MATQVLAQTPREQYDASVGQTTFTYPFQIAVAGDLDVYRIRSGVATLLTYATDYTLTDVGTLAGGTVELVSASVAGDKIVVVRNTDIERLSGYTTAGSVTGDNLNVDFNRFLRIGQELQNALARKVGMADSDTGSESGLTLPAAADRANKLWGFDASGDVELYNAIDGSATAATAAGGTLSRTLAAHFGEVLNVQDYNVLPGNTGAQNVAGMAALAANIADNVTIYFPPGAYDFDSASISSYAILTSPALCILPLGGFDNINVVGYSAKVSITGATETAIILANSCNNISVLGIEFIGNNLSTGFNAFGSAVYFFNGSGATEDFSGLLVADCKFSGFRGGGWVLVQSNSTSYRVGDISIVRNRFSGGGDRSPTTGTVSANQIMLTASSGCLDIRNFVIAGNHCEATEVKSGIALDSFYTRGVVAFNTILNAGQGYGAGVAHAYGLLAYSSGYDVKYIGNTIIDCYTGPYLISQVGAVVVGNTVVGQEETTDTPILRAGLVVSGSQLLIANNSVRDCARGISVQAILIGVAGVLTPDGGGIVIRGNVVRNATREALKVYSDPATESYDIRIEGNILESAATATYHAVNFTEISAPRFNYRTVFAGNTVRSGGLGLAAMSRWHSIEISHNRFLCPTRAIQMNSGSNTTPPKFAVLYNTFEGDISGEAMHFGGSGGEAGAIIGNIFKNIATGNCMRLNGTPAVLKDNVFLNSPNKVANAGAADLGVDTPTWLHATGQQEDGAWIDNYGSKAMDGSNMILMGWSYDKAAAAGAGLWRTVYQSTVSPAT